MKNIRESNIELLRIVSMFFVLIVHACFQSNGIPSLSQFTVYETKTVLESALEILAIPAVNIFILISGFFRIKISVSKIFYLIYIIVFWRFVLSLFFINFDSLSGIQFLLMLIPGYQDWFSATYLLLVIISPVVNKYIDNTSLRNLISYLLIFLLIETIMGWGLSIWTEYKDGYSTLHFIFLYILGNSIFKLYNQGYINKYKTSYLIISYLSIVVIELIGLLLGLLYLPESLSNALIRRIIAYNSPFTIAMACIVLIIFLKFEFKSNIINSLSKSSFSVYIIHQFPLVVPFYKLFFNKIYIESSSFLYIGILIGCCIIIYLTCFLGDQIRIKSYNLLFKFTKLKL